MSLIQRLWKRLTFVVKDFIFWAVFLDFILTLLIVYTGRGFESNPFVVYLGHFPSFLISFFIIYFILYKIPFNDSKWLYLIYFIWFSFLLVNHVVILLFGIG